MYSHGYQQEVSASHGKERSPVRMNGAKNIRRYNMPKEQTFEGVFDVVDIKAKRHTSGNRLEIVLSVNHDEDLHKQAISLLFKQVKASMIVFEPQPEMFNDEDEEPLEAVK
jgi:hypothetical protein